MSYIDTNNYNAAQDDMGTPWMNFEDTLFPEQVDLYRLAYNLISIVLRENSLSANMMVILTDNTIENTYRINLVRNLLITSIIDLISDMGVIINKDYVDMESLQPLCDILNVLYSTDDIDDVLGLIDILDNETYDNKEKLIIVIMKWLELDDDGNLPYIIEDVSSDVIKGIYLGLGAITIDDGDYINPDVAKRIKSNKDFLKGTLAGYHVINGGGVGLSFELLTNMFINELSQKLANDKKEYLTELMGLLIISSFTNIEIQEGYEQLISKFTEGMDEIYLGSKLLEQVVL